jgi:hypothetical protein
MHCVFNAPTGFIQSLYTLFNQAQFYVAVAGRYAAGVVAQSTGIS